MEEQVCLVRARSDSDNSKQSFGSIEHTMTYTEERLTAGTEAAGDVDNTVPPPDQSTVDNENGELLDYNDSSVLEQFHEDALKQAGCGAAQVRVVLACALATAGASLELAAIPFILPSAEIELCILQHEKNWLVLISLVGCSLGSLGWGALGTRLGRRRALMSLTAVNAVFAAIAAFMPTYGTFMMARFCSALGSGGIFPISYTYCGEVCPAAGRARALSALPLAAGGGALLAAALAGGALPGGGADTLQENKEHFSAWHRYLLLCMLPILASLVSLIWTHESPRYLLDVGREVDAMNVYQSMHSSNQSRVCGKANVAATNNRAPSYHLGELALPAKRRPTNPHQVKDSIKMFWQGFFQLFSGTYRRPTFCYGGILLFTMCIQYYLSSYVPATVARKDYEAFEAAKLTIQNKTIDNDHHNETMENIEYKFVTFTNCTFRDMMMSHITFKNCSFYDVAFTNIITSSTTFGGCLFVNSTLIDTDLFYGRELDPWCSLNNSVVRGMVPACSRHADLTTKLQHLVTEQSYVSQAMLLAAVLSLLPYKLRPTAILCGVLVALAPAIEVGGVDTYLYIVEAAYRLPLTLVFFNIALSVVDIYPANLRCTAHGIMLSLSWAGCAAVRGAGEGNKSVSALLCVAMALLATLLAVKPR